MQRLLLYIASIIVIAGSASAWFYGRLVDAPGNRSTIDGVMRHVSHANDRYDILVIGNSRARVHADTRVIDSVTGLNSYCLALDATNIIVHHMLLRKYLEARPAPSMVVLNVDFSSLDLERDLYNIPDYFPYLEDSTVYTAMSPYSYKFRYKPLQPLLRLQRMMTFSDDEKLMMLWNVVRGESSVIIPKPEEVYKGFSPQFREWRSDSMIGSFDAGLTDESLELIDACADECRRRGIRFVMMTAPLQCDYRKIVRNHREIEERIARYAADRDLTYLDYTTLPLCSDRRWFFNIEHLNAAGAAEFSRRLGRDLARLPDAESMASTMMSRVEKPAGMNDTYAPATRSTLP